MADTAIAITAGSGTNVDTRTEATNGNHRQVVVLGDPATNAGVAPVDATAGLKVDLGADNDITGTVTANLGATDNAVLDAIEADTTTLAGAVAGTEVQVDVLTMPTVTVTASNLDVQSGGADLATTTQAGAIQTAVEIIDNAVHVDDAAYTLGTHSGVMMMGFAGTQSVNANDAGAVAMETDGAVHIHDGGNTITVDGTVAVTNAGITTIAGAVSGTEMQVDVLTMPTVTVTATNLDVQSGGADLATSTQGAAIQTAVEILDNAISGSEMQVDVVAALPAGTNAIGKLAANSGVDIGDVDVTSISAGTNAIGNVGLIGRTTGGLTIFRSIDLDESEEEVKATAGQVFTITAFNRTAAPLYLKLYNATAANVTVGTTTPVMTFLVPANADSDGAGFIHTTDIGYAFGTAISAAVTTGVADNDMGAPGANDCLVNIGYV